MRGARPSFTEFHKWMALELIAEKKRISRKELSKWLSLGEGSVRTLLEELKKEGMVASCRSGHSLTAKGWKYLGEPLRYVQVDIRGITVGRVNVATLVRGAAEKVNPIRQRDEAIKVGASGHGSGFQEGEVTFPRRLYGGSQRGPREACSTVSTERGRCDSDWDGRFDSNGKSWCRRCCKNNKDGLVLLLGKSVLHDSRQNSFRLQRLYHKESFQGSLQTFRRETSPEAYFRDVRRQLHKRLHTFSFLQEFVPGMSIRQIQV